MKMKTGQRAALLIQGRMGSIPARGTIAYERWVCAQHAGRIYVSHVWDCPACNPEGLPPERLTSQHCHRAEMFFTEALVYRAALAQETGAVECSKIHKNWAPNRGPKVYNTTHLEPLIRA